MHHDDHPETISRNMRLGLLLFAVYVALYGGFMYMTAFKLERMGDPTPLGSVNLSIMYGMGLILAAFVLAIIYMFICRNPGKS